MFPKIFLLFVLLVYFKEERNFIEIVENLKILIHRVLYHCQNLFFCETNTTKIDEIIEKESNESEYNKFGILHSQQSYAEWAAKEEDIVLILREKLSILKLERQLLKSYHINNRIHPKIETYVSNFNQLQNRIQTLKKLRVFTTSVYHRQNTERVNISLQLFPSGKTTHQNESNARWIGTNDVYMSMTTFIHMQKVYMFPPENISQGIQLETTFGGSLNAAQTLEIGIFALYRDSYYISVHWLEYARNLTASLSIQRNSQRNGVQTNLINSLLLNTIQDHNRLKYKTLNETIEDAEMELELYLAPVTSNQSYHERIPNRVNNFDKKRNASLDARFTDLCLGNILQPIQIQKSLTCYYERNTHPFFFINPMKVEVLSESPPILQFYEVLGNKTIKNICDDLIHSVELSRLVSSSNVDIGTSWRTSAGILTDWEQIPEKVHRLTEYLSGMKAFDDVETQFVEYSYGRYYDYHYDAFADDNEHAAKAIETYGNRLATLLFYLELPDMGGYTPFVQAGVFARPVRDSAVFWLNLWRNGTRRLDVSHGSCPVIHGHKTIMNQWILLHPNFNHWKCSKLKDE